MASKVGSKGQVVIEKEIRDSLGVRGGSIAVQRLVGDRVEIRFLPPEHGRSLKGRLARERRGTVASSDWPDAVEEAWREAARAEETTGDGS